MPQTLSSDTPDKGRLRIHVDSALTRSPVENARIRIFDTGQPEKALEEIGSLNSFTGPRREINWLEIWS